jgi:hypothetical protein
MSHERTGLRLVTTLVGVALMAASSVACRDPNRAAARQDFRTAIMEDQAAAVRQLLDSGLDPNEDPTGDCSTPLALAATRGNGEILRMLVERGASVNAPASLDGSTALHCVAGLADDAAGMVGVLVQSGADVDAASGDGTTALMLAAARGHAATVAALLKSGPDLEVRSAIGKTAAEMAFAANRRDIVELLRRAGARIPLPVAANEDEAMGQTGLVSIATDAGTILVGETWDEAQSKIETGTRIDMKQESQTRILEIRRFNNQTYRLTFERDGKTGPFRLIRIEIQ